MYFVYTRGFQAAHPSKFYDEGFLLTSYAKKTGVGLSSWARNSSPMAYSSLSTKIWLDSKQKCYYVPATSLENFIQEAPSLFNAFQKDGDILYFPRMGTKEEDFFIRDYSLVRKLKEIKDFESFCIGANSGGKFQYNNIDTRYTHRKLQNLFKKMQHKVEHTNGGESLVSEPAGVAHFEQTSVLDRTKGATLKVYLVEPYDYSVLENLANRLPLPDLKVLWETLNGPLVISGFPEQIEIDEDSVPIFRDFFEELGAAMGTANTATMYDGKMEHGKVEAWGTRGTDVTKATQVGEDDWLSRGEDGFNFKLGNYVFEIATREEYDRVQNTYTSKKIFLFLTDLSYHSVNSATAGGRNASRQELQRISNRPHKLPATMNGDDYIMNTYRHTSPFAAELVRELRDTGGMKFEKKKRKKVNPEDLIDKGRAEDYEQFGVALEDFVFLNDGNANPAFGEKPETVDAIYFTPVRTINELETRIRAWKNCSACRAADSMNHDLINMINDVADRYDGGVIKRDYQYEVKVGIRLVLSTEDLESLSKQNGFKDPKKKFSIRKQKNSDDYKVWFAGAKDWSLHVGSDFVAFNFEEFLLRSSALTAAKKASEKDRTQIFSPRATDYKSVQDAEKGPAAAVSPIHAVSSVDLAGVKGSIIKLRTAARKVFSFYKKYVFGRPEFKQIKWMPRNSKFIRQYGMVLVGFQDNLLSDIGMLSKDNVFVNVDKSGRVSLIDKAISQWSETFEIPTDFSGSLDRFLARCGQIEMKLIHLIKKLFPFAREITKNKTTQTPEEAARLYMFYLLNLVTTIYGALWQEWYKLYRKAIEGKDLNDFASYQEAFEVTVRFFTHPNIEIYFKEVKRILEILRKHVSTLEEKDWNGEALLDASDERRTVLIYQRFLTRAFPGLLPPQ